MSRNVFTYGSLMFPEVWQRVVRGQYRSISATLDDHVRLAIVDETYPGMIARPGSQALGVLYFDVNADDLARLDHFEGHDYRRATLHVRTAGGEPVLAESYLYLPEQRLSKQDWLPEEFQMQRFLQTYCRDKLGDADS